MLLTRQEVVNVSFRNLKWNFPQNNFNLLVLKAERPHICVQYWKNQKLPIPAWDLELTDHVTTVAGNHKGHMTINTAPPPNT